VTYLEMREQPVRPTTPSPSGRSKLALLRAENPTLSFYRYLYGAVGVDLNWTDRLILDDDDLRAIIQHPLVEIYVLYLGGVPAGFVELDRRRDNEIELAYLGLLPEFAGRGWGRYLLDWAIHTAWSHGPERLWLHTCDLDNPRALPLYQRAGFIAYDQKIEKVVATDALSARESD
jgi:GNAT superfamily N-acetyltransferase